MKKDLLFDGNPKSKFEPEALDDHGTLLRGKLNETQARYVEARVFQKMGRKEAVRVAGSSGKESSLASIAARYEADTDVQAYKQYLEQTLKDEMNISLQELLFRARKAYDMAEAKGDIRNMTEATKLIASMGGWLGKDGKASKGSQDVDSGADGFEDGEGLGEAFIANMGRGKASLDEYKQRLSSFLKD